MMETYALVVVTVCWDKTEDVKERMIIRALKDFMGMGSRGWCACGGYAERGKCHTHTVAIDRSLGSLACLPPPEAFPSLLRLSPPSKRGCRQKRHLLKKRKSFWVAPVITSRLVSSVRSLQYHFSLSIYPFVTP